MNSSEDYFLFVIKAGYFFYIRCVLVAMETGSMLILKKKVAIDRKKGTEKSRPEYNFNSIST